MMYLCDYPLHKNNYYGSIRELLYAAANKAHFEHNISVIEQLYLITYLVPTQDLIKIELWRKEL